MKIETYHSVNASVDRAWMAYVTSGDHCFGIRFPAADEATAIASAEKWWNSELDRQRKYVNPAVDQLLDDCQMMKSGKIDLRGQGHVGKVWMLNRSTGERARVESSSVESYANNGFERAGPRSK